MARYYFIKPEPTEQPDNWDKPGWHIDTHTNVIVYRNADTGETVYYIISAEV